MHVNRTYSLKLTTVEDLHDKVRPKLRSKFVDRAIQDRLKPEFINWEAISTARLLSELRHREDVTDFLKRCISAELKVVE